MQGLYGFKIHEALNFLCVEEGEPAQLEEGDLGYHNGGDDLQDPIQVQRDAHLKMLEKACPDLENEIQDAPTHTQSIADDHKLYNEGFITIAYSVTTRKQNQRPSSPTDHLDDDVDELIRLLVPPRRHQLPMADMNKYHPAHVDAVMALALSCLARLALNINRLARLALA